MYTSTRIEYVYYYLYLNMYVNIYINMYVNTYRNMFLTMYFSSLFTLTAKLRYKKAALVKEEVCRWQPEYDQLLEQKHATWILCKRPRNIGPRSPSKIPWRQW